MRKLIIAALALSLSGAATAQEPDEATKTWALKRAYQLNGNSMVGWDHMIDLTNEKPFVVVVPTEKIAATPPAPMPAVIASAERLENVCQRHGMHKVVTSKSWRCRK